MSTFVLFLFIVSVFYQVNGLFLERLMKRDPENNEAREPFFNSFPRPPEKNLFGFPILDIHRWSHEHGHMHGRGHRCDHEHGPEIFPEHWPDFVPEPGPDHVPEHHHEYRSRHGHEHCHHHHRHHHLPPPPPPPPFNGVTEASNENELGSNTTPSYQETPTWTRNSTPANDYPSSIENVTVSISREPSSEEYPNGSEVELRIEDNPDENNSTISLPLKDLNGTLNVDFSEQTTDEYGNVLVPADGGRTIVKVPKRCIKDKSGGCRQKINWG